MLAQWIQEHLVALCIMIPHLTQFWLLGSVLHFMQFWPIFGCYEWVVIFVHVWLGIIVFQIRLNWEKQPAGESKRVNAAPPSLEGFIDVKAYSTNQSTTRFDPVWPSFGWHDQIISFMTWYHFLLYRLVKNQHAMYYGSKVFDSWIFIPPSCK